MKCFWPNIQNGEQSINDKGTGTIYIHYNEIFNKGNGKYRTCCEQKTPSMKNI